MKIKELVLRLGAQGKATLSRFSCASAFTVGLFAVLVWDIVGEPYRHLTAAVFAGHLLRGLLLGFVAAVCVRVAAERFSKALPRVLEWVIPAALAAAATAAFQLWPNSAYVPMVCGGVLAALLCLTVWLLYAAENAAVLFAYLVKTAVFCGVAAFVLMLGLFLCLWAFGALLYLPSQFYNAYAVAAVFAWVLVALNLFLAHLPKPGEALSLPRAYDVLTGSVMLPLYTLLLFILYGYCIKIVVTWQLPSGQINWFASFALLFFVFFFLGLRTHKSRLARFAVRWGGLALAPVVVVQLICIGVRLFAYGLTPLRWLSLACLAMGVTVMVWSVLKKSPKPLFLIAAAVALAVTCTPLNALDVPQWNQTARLKSALRANEMYDGVSITPAAQKPSAEDRVRISSCYNYLCYSDAWRSSFVREATEGSFETLYGFSFTTSSSSENEEEVPETHSVFYNAHPWETGVEVTGYTRFYSSHESAYSNRSTQIELSLAGGGTYRCDLLPYAQQLYDTYGDNSQQDLTMEFAPDADTLVHLDYLELDVRDGKVEDIYSRWYVLRR